MKPEASFLPRIHGLHRPCSSLSSAAWVSGPRSVLPILRGFHGTSLQFQNPYPVNAACSPVPQSDCSFRTLKYCKNMISLFLQKQRIVLNETGS